MTLMEAVRNFVQTYPPLAEAKLRVDFLTPETDSYSIDAVPCKEVIKPYLDGSAQKQYLFILATRSFFGAHIRQQLDNLGFFEDFARWLARQQQRRYLPALGEGRRAQKMEVVSSGYAFLPGGESARYQIQCRMIYMEKGERKHETI